MLRFLAENQGQHFCDAVSRRELLRVGGLGSLGLTLPALLKNRAEASSADAVSFGKAKRVILLYMWGGPAHQDTWDLKPHGPDATRGEFLPIATTVPGMHISEHFPLIAQHADKLAILRSVGQDDNNHSTGAHAGLTGRRHELKAESFGARDTDFPHYGSVLTRLQPAQTGLPTFVALPEVIHTTNGAITPGQFGGILGKRYDPFQINQHPDEPGFAIDSLKLSAGIDRSRMSNRRELLAGIDAVARVADRAVTAKAMDAFYTQALEMVLSPKTRAAFDINAIPEETRRRYGWHTFGQSVLLAKHLIETGVKLVTVYWHREHRVIDTSWDTHARNFTELKTRLMPSVDRPIAALLEDLEASGMLDETLIVWNSEFGRTPRINANGGRDHWGPCNSVVMAGGGVPGGQVFGSSDAKAAYPMSEKVTQDHIAATIYHLLGIDPETLIYDRLKRPYPVALGEPIYKLLGSGSIPKPVADPVTRVDAPKIGRFTSMLRERGVRHITVDFGNPDSETDWKLTGWSKPAGTGLDRFRTTGDAAKIKYGGLWYTHFNYHWLVIRLAKPQLIADVKLTLEGKPIPISEELAKQPPQQVWQIRFPDGMVPAAKSFDLAITAPDWQITDIAVTGDEIRKRHLSYV